MICGKQIFQSKTDARNHIAGSNQDRRRHKKSVGRLTSTYWCNDCNGWHIASKEFKKTKKRTERKETDPVAVKKSKKDSRPLFIRNYSSRPI